MDNGLTRNSDYTEGILLDANENAYGPSLQKDNLDAIFKGVDLHRYPDPWQLRVKRQLCAYRNSFKGPDVPSLTVDNMFIGSGSDEAIDIIFRVFCRPGKDKVLICPPTYGMYPVAAQMNDVGVVHIPLHYETDFSLQDDRIVEAIESDDSIRMVFICSPGNPSGQQIKQSQILRLLRHTSFNGIIAVDEAYVDFADPATSMACHVNEYQNLVVFQTLSKAFGLAGIRYQIVTNDRGLIFERLGAAFAHPSVAKLMNCLKSPYNVSATTLALAEEALSAEGLARMSKHVSQLTTERVRLAQALPSIPGLGNIVGGTDTNFILIQVLDKPGGKPSNEMALKIYEDMASSRGLVVRFRGKELGCEGCLRVTIGTREENTQVLDIMTKSLKMNQ